MTQKRPKITVTEENKKFVIPTLKSLGGVNRHNFKDYQLKTGQSFKLHPDNAIVINLFDEDVYEVHPKDYVDGKGRKMTYNLSATITDEVLKAQHTDVNKILADTIPTLVVGADSYPKTLETIIEAQKQNAKELESKLNTLKLFATTILTKHKTLFGIMDLPEETKDEVRRICGIAKEY